jgi:hypothetical protein
MFPVLASLPHILDHSRLLAARTSEILIRIGWGFSYHIGLHLGSINDDGFFSRLLKASSANLAMDNLQARRLAP